MDEPRDVVSQITEYLSNGGLFNPELMPLPEPPEVK
jgi:hypothetical protein